MACYWRPHPRSAAPQSAYRVSQVDLYGQAHAHGWPLLWCRSNHFGRDWLASQTRYARGSFSRRALHVSGDAPCHSSAKPPPLEGLSPSHGAFQGHAAHLAAWSATLRPKGSGGTCRPHGVTTFFHTAFTAHNVVGVAVCFPSLQTISRSTRRVRTPTSSVRNSAPKSGKTGDTPGGTR